MAWLRCALAIAVFSSPWGLSCLAADKWEAVAVSPGGKGFVLAGKPFVPWGFNYDHDEAGRLLEDYWESEWPKVVADFGEMRDLGANVVRVHLQFGKFMRAAGEPDQAALQQLKRLLALAEDSQLYLDITGLGCYHRQEVPAWYDELSEADRWKQQSVFWEAVARQCSNSSAIFCYDLMNEPVVPGGRRNAGDWLGPPFAGKHFVQCITLDQADRPRPAIAQAWVEQLAAAVRRLDARHLITVGLVDWSLDRPGLTSGFVPDKVAGSLDFLCVHLYPESGKLEAAMETLAGFAADKPVIIEETFPLKCSGAEFTAFLDRSAEHASGWIGFYWGKTREECRQSQGLADALMLHWLDLFAERATRVTGMERQPRR